MECFVFCAISLDGFIARKNGDLDWLDKCNENAPKGEDCGYKDFMKDVDVLVMGRNTFEKVLSFGIDWPYENKKVIVLTSSTSNIIPENINSHVFQTSESVCRLHARLKSEGVKKVYVDGGKVIQSFLKEDLLDQLILTTMPIAIGSGISFFEGLRQDAQFELIYSKAYSFGAIQSSFKIFKKEK